MSLRPMALLLTALAFCAAALTGSVLAAEPAAARSAPLGVGDLAPDFTLLDQDGQPHTLSAALAKQDFVVLVFYRGHW